MGVKRDNPYTWEELGIEVNRSGPTEQDALCPKCSHTRKKRKARCLGVNLGSGEFYCHHCGAFGNQEYGWSDDDPGGYGSRLPPTKPKSYSPPKSLPSTPVYVEDAPPETPEEKAWDDAVKFFQKRGIRESTLRRNGVTVVQHYMVDADDGNGDTIWAVAFPYIVDGVHVNTKYRGIAEKVFQMSPKARLVWYGADDIPGTDAQEKDRRGIIVEGEIDKLAFEEAGWKNVISVPGGAPSPNVKNYDSKFDFMEDFDERFGHIRKWILACDNDAPGRKLTEELARRIGPERCELIDWAGISTDDTPIKDANDALIAFGREGFRKRVGEIKRPYPIEGLFSVADFKKALEDRYLYGPPPSLPTGWKAMDRAYKVRTKLCTIVTGVPNIGKSTFLNALAVNMMSQHDFRFAICSPEWQPIDDMIAAMSSVLVGKPFYHWHPGRMTPAEREWAEEWLNERVEFIMPEEPTIDAILERAEHVIRRIGARGLIIDPWSEIDTSYLKPRDISQTDWIGQNVRKIRRFSKSRDVHTWLVVHPTKVEKKSDGEYPVLDIYDLAGSAHFANMADQVLSLWRSEFDDSNTVEVHVKKSRFRSAGRRGEIVELQFDELTGRFSDPNDHFDYGIADPWNMHGKDVAD